MTTQPRPRPRRRRRRCPRGILPSQYRNNRWYSVKICTLLSYVLRWSTPVETPVIRNLAAAARVQVRNVLNYRKWPELFDHVARCLQPLPLIVVCITHKIYSANRLSSAERDEVACHRRLIDIATYTLEHSARTGHLNLTH